MMPATDNPIPVTVLKRGIAQAVTELHITGGLRATIQGNKLWSLHPLLHDNQTVALSPMPINHVRDLMRGIRVEIFGADEIVGLGTPLIYRVWTLLDGTHDTQMQPADTWSIIADTADRAGDAAYASLAHNLSYSLHAAGIRLRDASDCYEVQLQAAIQEKRKAGPRFSNLLIRDLQLSFHSVLSELSSARDYLAASLAHKLGAPSKVDALNRFAEWIKPTAKAEMRGIPVVRAMLEAYDPSSPDPWLHQLTEYRNLFLHREPLGAKKNALWFHYNEAQIMNFICPTITMPLGNADPSAPGCDALLRFVKLYRQMTALARLAAVHAPYEPEIQNFIAS